MNTTATRARRATRLVSLVASGAVAVLPAAVLAAPAAHADTAGAVTAAYAGVGAGYNNVINGHAAGSYRLTVEGGDTVDALCVDEPAAFNSSATYTAGTRAAAGVTSLDRVADIVTRHASIGTPLADAAQEMVATQLAVWKLTNGTDFSTVNNQAERDRAAALLAGSGSAAEGPSSFVLTASADRSGQKVTVHVQLATASGTPLAGQTVNVTDPAGTTALTTDAAGTATGSFSATAAGQVSASWTGQLPAGTVLLPSTGQKVVTLQAATVHRNASAAFTAYSAPAPKRVAPKPAPKRVQPRLAPPVVHKKLAYTGTWVHPWMVLLALAGALAALTTRRRLARRG